MKKSALAEIIGWVGGIIILTAYALLNFELISPNNPSYQIMNLVGSFGLCYAAYTKRAKQPLLVNLIWIIIAITALGGILIWN